MKKRIRSNIYSGIMMFLLLLTAVAVSVAWIESDVSPEIKAQMKLASSPGLLMSLNGNITDEIDINQFVLDQSRSIVLAEGSSASGTYEKLFIRYSDEPLTSIFADNAAPTDVNKKFIYFTFSLTAASDNELDVWFDSSSLIDLISTSVSAVKAKNVIRVSLTVTDEYGVAINANNGCSTTIFGNRQEKFGTYQTWAVRDIDRTTHEVVPFDQLSSADQPLYYARQDVHLFSEYNDADHAWLTLDRGQLVKVKMLVWLEGTDQDCVDSSTEQVSGSELSLLIKFNSGVRES